MIGCAKQLIILFKKNFQNSYCNNSNDLYVMIYLQSTKEPSTSLNILVSIIGCYLNIIYIKVYRKKAELSEFLFFIQMSS